jgi:serine/threonine protein kinase/CRP-like cAMP-binding protein
MTEFLGTTRYQPVRRLGAGGMGIVYEVFDRERGEHVALKTLSRVDPAGIYDLKKEFRALADVRHPNVVTLHEMVNDDDRWFFTMELVHGVPFTEHVARAAPGRSWPDAAGPTLSITETRIDPRQRRPFDEARLRAALAQLVLGVSAIHAAGRLHRDLKPSNVLVTSEGRVVVLDFGLVQDDGRSNEPYDTSLDEHWLVGTPAYMAPEQAAGHRATKATDWYAVGAMLYRALTGQLPFDGSLNEVLLRKQSEDPRAPSTFIEGLPQDLEQLALHLIQRSAEARADEATVRRRLVLDVAPVRSSQPPDGERLVGRESERAWLQAALEASRRGVPQVLFLEGPSGFGKTALAQHFSRELRRDPSAVLLAGRCYPREALPYKAFDAVIDALSRYLSRLPETRAHELLPRNCRALTSLFPVLERVPAIQTQRSLALPPATLSEQRERAFAALKELLGRISDQGPLVLLIENLDWGDEDSAQLLLRVCSAPDPPALLLIGTHRPQVEADGSFFARLGARSSKLGEAVRQHRSIGPLAPEHAFQLCKEMLDCSDRVAWRLAEETAGDPLLISLLCEHLREHPDGIPAGARAPLEALLDFELQRLDADARTCLDLIAVAGAPVLPEVLGEALGLPAEQTRLCLSRLTEEGLLQLVYHQGRESVSVRHERIARELTARMTAAEIAAYHSSWADALLARGDSEPETLADHYWKAGQEPLARRFAIQAARRAERGLAFDRAVHLYERALALSTSASERAEILERLADTRLHLGEPGNAAAALLEAARLSPPERAVELRKRSAALRLTDEQLDALFAGSGNGDGLFDGITREAVQAFLAKGQLIDAAQGVCVSRRSDRPASVLVVLAGGLRVEQTAGSVEVGPGEILGTLSLLHDTPRLADVYASVDGTRVLRITRASLEELNQNQPQLALQLTLNLARILCGKLVNVHARAFRLPA